MSDVPNPPVPLTQSRGIPSAQVASGVNTVLVTASTTGYRDLAERLVRSALKFGVVVESLGYESTGDWVKNGHIKPQTILASMLASDRRRPVCWIDADAELMAAPKALDGISGADVAVCRLATKEVLSGTVWFAPTPGAMWLLAAWHDECRAHPSMWDQHALYKAMSRARAPIKVAELDHSLCFIPGTSPPCRKGSPVIVHHQASREVRAGTRSM